MELEKLEKNHVLCALVRSDAPVITDGPSALDVLMRAKYELGTKNIIIAKHLLADDFFILSKGLAGEVLQKYVNYGGRIAVYGDYSGFTSKALKAFMYESNQGRDVFFAATREEALDLLTR